MPDAEFPMVLTTGRLLEHWHTGSMTRRATVLDDLDCAPDSTGISHCHNPLLLADGRRVEIVHPHSMAVVPCLTRGEHVRLGWQ